MSDQAVQQSHGVRSPRLDSIARVRREAARLYREGRAGTRPAGDVHQLAATLAIVGQLIEAGRS